MPHPLIPVVSRPGDEYFVAGDVRERTDASRNRLLILRSAQELIAERGVSCLTMDALAEKAGVGKGTIFRRFGSRSGLMTALLDHSERDFQQCLLSGPPPLGPGAPALERLLAYGRAIVERFELTGELQQAADAQGWRLFAVPARLFQHQHVAMLLRAGGCRGDAELLAHTLMAGLEPRLLHYQLKDANITTERVVENWNFMVREVLPTPP